jgi:hypothetical protein
MEALMRRLATATTLAGLLLLAAAGIAIAEGETIQVVSVDCQGILVRGGGYTPGQDLLTFARAPQGEGTITNQVTAQANADGMMPTTTLTFGGQVPDGTYEAVITTPGSGQREEVTARFQVSGCGPPGAGLPFTGSHTLPTAGAGMLLLAAGVALIRWSRTAPRH